MSDEWTTALAILGAVGSLASIVGLPLVFCQLHKTKRATDAALEAVADERERSRRECLMKDMSWLGPIVEDIQAQVRSGHYEAARIRLGQLFTELSRMRRLPMLQDAVTQAAFAEQIDALVDLSKVLDGRLQSPAQNSRAKVSVGSLYAVQLFISDQLGRLEVLDAKGDTP